MTPPGPSLDGGTHRNLAMHFCQPLRAIIQTNKGALNITLDAVNAPMTVNNFVVLARYHYFDNTICPRIVPGYLF